MEHLPNVQHGSLGVVAQLPGGETEQHQGDHRGQLPGGEGLWQGGQHLASQNHQEEGEDEAVPIGEPVGHFEEVPHLVQGRQPQREHQHYQHCQSGQLVPAGNGGGEEKDQGQHQDHSSAEQIGQGRVGQTRWLAGEQAAGQLPQGEVGEAGVVHGGVPQLSAENGQQGGHPHPGGDPQGGQSGEEERPDVAQHVLPRSGLTPLPVDQPHTAEDTDHVGDVPGGDKAHHQAAKEQPGPLSCQNPLQSQEDDRQPDEPIQPHDA